MSDIIAADCNGVKPSAIGIIRLSARRHRPGGPGFAPLGATRLAAAPDRSLILGNLLDETGRVLDQILP